MGHGRPFGCQKKTTFSEISPTLLNIISWLFLVPKKSFGDLFWNVLNWESRKLSNNKISQLSFSKKKTFSEISPKLLHIFSWLFLAPTEDFWRYLSECSELEKSENEKNKICYFFFENKKTFSELSPKLLDIFSWQFLVPAKEFQRHLLDCSELAKSEIFRIKNSQLFLLRKNATVEKRSLVFYLTWIKVAKRSIIWQKFHPSSPQTTIAHPITHTTPQSPRNTFTMTWNIKINILP